MNEAHRKMRFAKIAPAYARRLVQRARSLASTGDQDGELGFALLRGDAEKFGPHGQASDLGSPRRKEARGIGKTQQGSIDKAPDSFLRACALALPSLPGWRAEIIGADGMSATSRETEYVRQIRDLAATSGVRYTGYLDHPLVLKAMTRAAIVIVPSRWNEPFGLTALEAIACGAALIVSPRGGLPEVAGDAAVYANPDDPEDIAAAILALAGDEARRGAMSDAGRQRARRFDTPVAAGRLAGLRRAVLNRRG